MSVKEPLYLVDGSGYIFRAYYAIAPLSNDAGLPTNALLGFSRMLMKLLKDVSAKYIAVTFDMAAPTFRHKMYSEYKANRSECPEDLVPQMPYFRSIVQALGIACLEKEGFEADDIIATVTKRVASADQKIIIVSGDKDLTQLVDDSVEVWDAMRDIHYNPEAVKAKFGVYPEQIIDYLALMGDSSDNIPGLKGVGAKTATKLLEALGSIENLLKEPDKVLEIQGLRGKEKLRGQLESSVDVVRLSQDLVKLDTCVHPFSEVEAVDEFSWTEPKMDQLVPLFEELSFSSLLRELPSGESTITPAEETREFRLLSAGEFDEFVRELSEQPAFAFDTETTGFDVKSIELLGISISWEAHKAYYIPLASVCEPEKVISLEQVRSALGPIFADEKIKKYGLNLKYDASVLEENGYSVNGMAFDSMLASYVLNPDKRQHGLKALARIHLQDIMKTFKEVVGDAEHLGHVPLEEVSDYACHDADVSWRLPIILGPRLEEGSRESFGSKFVFEQIEMPLVAVLSKMERRGIRLDSEMLASLSTEAGSELATLETSVYELTENDFNLNSPKQLAEVLFDRIGISTKGVKKTKSGYSTDASVLKKLSSEHPAISKILEYRELHKLKSTYLDALPKLVHPKTGRIHTSFNQAVAATGRLSSSDPNLQNIPIRTERGRQLREAFIAEEGSVLVSADYSQIELRVLAHLCEDEALCRAFREGEDIHSSTARELFGMASGEEAKKLRRIAKTINFGLLYGMSAFRLANELEVSRKQAADYVDRYFNRFSGIKRYFETVTEGADKLGYTETLFGRRRYAKDIETAGRDAGYAKRSLMNAPIQGTAAEIIKLAMIKLEQALVTFGTDVGMVLQVHDELVVEVPRSLAEEVQQVVVKEMEAATNLSVPIKVDSRIGTCWGEV